MYIRAENSNTREEWAEEGRMLTHVRVFKGPLKIIISFLAVSLSLFHLYTGAFGSIFLVYQRCVHISLASVIIFALYPFSKKTKRGEGIPILDMIFIALSLIVYIYPILVYKDWTQRMGIPNTLDIIFGGLTILLVLEACRRVIGPAITIVASVFLLYAYFGPYIPGLLSHRSFPLSRIIEFQYMTTEGIFGIPLGVSATFVFLFILFSAFVIKCGIGKFFTDLAMSVAGSLPGGPAKVAVVASGFEGMISGSTVANVVTSGSVTIPLMKSIGYPAHFAAAVEATASTGGQFMPPIMGAGAFVMAEFLGVSYTKIALLAFLPACFYYFACYMQIHYRALKLGLKGLPRTECPKLWDVLKKGFYFFIPIGVLVYFLLSYYSIMRVAFLAIVASIIVGVFRRGENRLTLRMFFEALEDGARKALGVAAACACAGIIVGVMNMTGLGLKFTAAIVDLSHDFILPALGLTAVVCIIMGMGVPPVAAYIIVATMAAPALTKIGILPIVAHLFVYYFAVLGDITPPVCIGAYTAAGIAGANPIKTGLTATKLGIAIFIVPFIFCYDPALLGLGNVFHVVLRASITFVAIVALAGGAEGYLLRKNKFYETLMLFAAAFLLIIPGWVTDLAGFIILSTTIFLQFFTGHKDPLGYVGLLARFLNICFGSRGHWNRH